MSKKVKLTTRPAEHPNLDHWVVPNSGQRERSQDVIKRLTIDIDRELHTELKVHCVKTDQLLGEFVLKLIVKALRNRPEDGS